MVFPSIIVCTYTSLFLTLSRAGKRNVGQEDDQLGTIEIEAKGHSTMEDGVITRKSLTGSG